MRFHHSTRRGRNRLAHNGGLQLGGQRAAGQLASASRWSQLSYCRETNIHFNRRLPVEPPAGSKQADGDSLAREEGEFVEAGKQVVCSPLRQLSCKSGAGANEHDQRDRGAHLLQQIDDSLHKLSIGEQKEGTAADSGARINLEEARERLVAQVVKHPFWSNKAARRMQLTDLEERNIYIYELLSYCERRDLEWRYEPYKGGLVSSIPLRQRPDFGSSATSSQPSAPAGHLTADLVAGQRMQQGQLFVSAFSQPGGGSTLATKRQHHRPWGSESESQGPSPIRRSCSSAATSTTMRDLYEPISVIERPLPSPELVWSIQVPGQLKPEPFAGYAHSTELANSSFVKRCHGCRGRGRLKCNSCYGVGYEVCISCSGKGTTKSLSSAASASNARHSSRHYGADGYNLRNSTHANGYADDQDSSAADLGRRPEERGGISGSSSGQGTAWLTESCHFCHGAGQKRCWVCAGKSYNHCLACSGLGQLRCYLNLTVTWINHRDESILNNSDNIIPRERLRLSSGLVIADETGNRLSALARARIDGATGRVEDANQLHLASRKLLDKHAQLYRSERLIKQVGIALCWALAC